HHVQRCGAIIEILRTGPKTAEEIAQEHFEESLLEGFGSIMAANEIVSHCEFLVACGDMVGVNENQYGETGTANFEKYILYTNKLRGEASDVGTGSLSELH
ncbi:MAG: hypothetical protein IMF02_12675, partial [Proteobacteria bacterium]|nr:hypothetical protein [Pseudomonadota bacterium]